MLLPGHKFRYQVHLGLLGLKEFLEILDRPETAFSAMLCLRQLLSAT
jgi:hypothetical protein